MRDDVKQTIQQIKLRHNVSKCRSCDAEIRWIETKRGKKMPIDLRPVSSAKNGDLLVSEYSEFYRVTEIDERLRCLPERGKWFKSHFATCPQAAEHRRR